MIFLSKIHASCATSNHFPIPSIFLNVFWDYLLNHLSKNEDEADQPLIPFIGLFALLAGWKKSSVNSCPGEAFSTCHDLRLSRGVPMDTYLSTHGHIPLGPMDLFANLILL